MSNGEWKRKCAELEEIKDRCQAAFELIPIWALEREEIWMPSADMLVTLKRAKDSIRDYNEAHHSGRGKE